MHSKPPTRRVTFLTNIVIDKTRAYRKLELAGTLYLIIFTKAKLHCLVLHWTQDIHNMTTSTSNASSGNTLIIQVIHCTHCITSLAHSLSSPSNFKTMQNLILSYKQHRTAGWINCDKSILDVRSSQWYCWRFMSAVLLCPVGW